MILHKTQQGSAEWYALRAGVVTSSCFDKIITPVTGKLSKSADKYAYRVAWELVSGESSEIPFDNYWMERGAILEADARALYEFQNNVTLSAGGFITSDDGWIGCSPDALICDAEGRPRAGVEIKCPAPWTHIENMLRNGKIDPQYRPQVQGQIYVGGLEYVDWFSYHPELPSVRLSEQRDEEYQSNLAEALNGFVERLKEILAKLGSLGVERATPGALIEQNIFRYMAV